MIVVSCKLPFDLIAGAPNNKAALSDLSWLKTSNPIFATLKACFFFGVIFFGGVLVPGSTLEF